MSFEEWLVELDSAAIALGYEGSITSHTGHECWRTSFDDGITPAEALAEDWSYADG
jgi:hypothetical protein